MSLRILGGAFKGRPLKSPQSSPTRPTQGILRQAVFNICQSEINHARFLDLFAGSGAMGLEALSRGASFATFVEQNSSAARCIRENIEILQVQNRSALLTMDIFAALRQLSKRNAAFDIIYIDPPYEKATLVIHRVLQDLEKLSLIAPNGAIMIEESSQTDETSYESATLKQNSVRRYGIARLVHLSKSF